MLVSIIVPVYNSKHFLAKCADSILKQSYTDIEVVLVDDGSNDGSAEICDSYMKKDSRVRAFHTENRGVSSARNFGLKQAKGEYITFIDADDLIDTRYVEKLFNLCKKFSADISTCGWQSAHKADMTEYVSDSVEEVSCIKAVDYNFLAKYSHQSVWGALFKKNIIEDLSFDTDVFVAEDTLFFARALKNSTTITHTNEKLYCYIQHDMSATHSVYDAKRFTEIKAWERLCELFSDNAVLQHSCYATLGLCCEKGLKKMAESKSLAQPFYKDIIKKARKQLCYVMKCNISSGRKVKYLALCIFSKFYLSLYVMTHRGRIKK